MKNECIDKNIGSRLHAYELDLLSEEETEQFEIHFMKCEYCLSQVRTFSKESDLMTSDDDIKSEIQQLSDKVFYPSKTEETKKFLFSKLLKPLTNNPALSVILLLVIVASYFYINTTDILIDDEVQQVRLLPHRSTASINYLEPNESIELVFIYDESVLNDCYELTIWNKNDSIIYETKSFCDFDESNVGKITFPKDSFLSGRYKLLIVNPAIVSANNSQEYRFTLLYK